jgi:hypothetical protein
MTDFASLAQGLKDNEAFQAALDAIRENARDSLGTVAATDADAIRKHQATVQVVDDIRDNLVQMIRSGKPRSAPGLP